MLKNQSWIIILLLGLGLQAQAATDCAAVTEIPSTECEALVDFYTKTGGSSWFYHGGWNVTNTPCSWYKVTCEDGHLTKLSLASNQLSGFIPPSLGNLSHLTVLNLGSNQLSGSIPTSLGKLSHLESLSLAENKFSGSIPPQLAQLSNLEYLSLSSNQLSGTIVLLNDL